MKSLMMACVVVTGLSGLLIGCNDSQTLGPTACSTTEAVDTGASSTSADMAALPAPKEIAEPVSYSYAQSSAAQPMETKLASEAPAKPVAQIPAAKPAAKPAAAPKVAAAPAPAPAAKPIPQPVVIQEPLASRPSLAPATDTKKLRTYSIRKGDTLYGISRKLYNGDARKYKDIIRANPGVNPDRLLVGTTLNIP